METVDSGPQNPRNALIEGAVRQILSALGEDPEREGLLATPDRVARALLEMTRGYAMTPETALATTFASEGRDMVILTGIRFSSMCEHHMLPFTGVAAIGYIPAARIVGISKLARLVEVYARRLQVQERLAAQVADALDSVLAPEGVGVLIRAHHACMGCRGVNQPDAQMVTTALRGCFLTKPDAKQEFIATVTAIHAFGD